MQRNNSADVKKVRFFSATLLWLWWWWLLLLVLLSTLDPFDVCNTFLALRSTHFSQYLSFLYKGTQSGRKSDTVASLK